MAETRTLTVNGEPRRSAAPTIAALVQELELKPEKVAVERNGVIVPRSTLAEAPLADGDVLESSILSGAATMRPSTPRPGRWPDIHSARG
jgi:thiazole synthase